MNYVEKTLTKKKTKLIEQISIKVDKKLSGDGKTLKRKLHKIILTLIKSDNI